MLLFGLLHKKTLNKNLNIPCSQLTKEKYQKLKDKFIKKNKYHFEIRFVRDEEFRFKAVSPEEGSVFVNPEEAEKAAMESNKKKQKEHKQETE